MRSEASNRRIGSYSRSLRNDQSRQSPYPAWRGSSGSCPAGNDGAVVKLLLISYTAAIAIFSAALSIWFFAHGEPVLGCATAIGSLAFIVLFVTALD